MWRAIGAVVLLFIIPACGDDDSASGTVDITNDAPQCDTLFAPGAPVDDILERLNSDNGTCSAGENNITVIALANYACPDGRTLYWDDHGWGYSGGTWQPHARPDGQLVPPQADLDACQT